MNCQPMGNAVAQPLVWTVMNEVVVDVIVFSYTQVNSCVCET